jgi:aspartate 1-decarboxylase
MANKMLRTMLKSKIHLATVTETVLEYEGSIGIDSDLIAAAGLMPFEKVDVVNVNNGQRFQTYVIESPAGSGTISLNGAAARLAVCGDRVIIMNYALMDENEAAAVKPEILLMGEGNRIERRVSPS